MKIIQKPNLLRISSFLLANLVIAIATSFGQVQDGFNYQAILRDAAGNIKANASAVLQIEILKGSATGAAVFSESHNTATNAFGLINLEIGSENGSGFSAIHWSEGPFFLKVSVNGNDMGTSQILSVPYALHAKTVEEDRVDDADADPANELQTIYLSGTMLTLSNGGGSVTLPSTGGGDNWGTQTVVTDATLSGNGSAASPLKIAPHGAVSGQVLKWNGSAWAPGADNEGGLTLPYEGTADVPSFGGAFTMNVNGAYASAIRGIGKTQGNGVEGIGTCGGITESTGVYGHTECEMGYGVKGYSPYTGVRGHASAVSGTTFGVYGESDSPDGYAVYGTAPKYGVYGISYNTRGRAVTGTSNGTSSIGVMGLGLTTNSTGVWGEGANYDFYANGPGTDYGTGSSIRWKKNIQLISDPLEKIKAIRGVSFDWDEAHGGQHDVGMIAEEVGRVLPEIVVYEENGVDASGMDYSKTTPLLLEGIKALLTEIEQLKNENERLKANQQKLTERLDAIENRVSE